MLGMPLGVTKHVLRVTWVTEREGERERSQLRQFHCQFVITFEQLLCRRNSGSIIPEGGVLALHCSTHSAAVFNFKIELEHGSLLTLIVGMNMNEKMRGVA